MNVVWENYEYPERNIREWGSNALLEDTLVRSKWGESLIHRRRFAELPNDISGAVVICPNNNAGHIGRLYQDLQKLSWVMLLIVGDEDGIFPTPNVRALHSNMKVWYQYPRQGNDTADRYMICGYPPQAQKLLPGLLAKNLSRNHAWFFSGQSQNERRHQCITQLRTDSRGDLQVTKGFWQGFAHEEYYRRMVSAKIVPCPAGTSTPDTFRLAEALEAGCIPIADGRGPNSERHDYWRQVFGGDVPFPVADSWNNLPRQISDILVGWESKARDIGEWWKSYKRNLVNAFENDIEEIQ